MKNNSYTEYEFKWRDRQIKVRHCSSWLSGDVSHIEIYSEDKKDLPMTETGFRSHFTNEENINSYGGPVELVKEWLNIESKSRRWKEYIQEEMRTKQLSLF